MVEGHPGRCQIEKGETLYKGKEEKTKVYGRWIPPGPFTHELNGKSQWESHVTKKNVHQKRRRRKRSDTSEIYPESSRQEVHGPDKLLRKRSSV